MGRLGGSDLLRARSAAARPIPTGGRASRDGPPRGAAGRTRALAAFFSALVIAAIPRPVAAQGKLVGVRMQADLVEAVRDVRVELEYEVWLQAGATEIPLRGLEFRPTAITDVGASLTRPAEGESAPSGDTAAAVSRDALTVEMDPGAGMVASGRVVLDRPWPADGPLDFWLVYDVRNAVEAVSGGGARYRLPVLVAGWAPDQAARHTFVARARLPNDLTVTESFPAVIRDITVNPNVQRVGMDLQVVPALVSLRTERGRGRVSGLLTAVDLSVLVLLSVLLVLGARHLERVSPGRRV